MKQMIAACFNPRRAFQILATTEQSRAPHHDHTVSIPDGLSRSLRPHGEMPTSALPSCFNPRRAFQILATMEVRMAKEHFDFVSIPDGLSRSLRRRRDGCVCRIRRSFNPRRAFQILATGTPSRIACRAPKINALRAAYPKVPFMCMRLARHSPLSAPVEPRERRGSPIPLLRLSRLPLLRNITPSHVSSRQFVLVSWHFSGFP